MSARVYPTIDPEPHFSAQTYRGKVVLITGASRGIGAETALAYARAGASVAILARWQKTLDERAAEIRSSVPGAQVLVVPADVRDVQAVDAAVQTTLSRFERIDIVVANAGAITLSNRKSVFFNFKLGRNPHLYTVRRLDLHAKDPDGWWNTFEVNIRGVHNTFRCADIRAPMRLSVLFLLQLLCHGSTGVQWVLHCRFFRRSPTAHPWRQRLLHLKARRQQNRRIHRGW